MGAFGWPHLLIILAVILLLFGAAKLPALAKSLGQSARVFKGEMKAMKNEDATDVAGSGAPVSGTATPGASAADTNVVSRDSESGQPPRSV